MKYLGYDAPTEGDLQALKKSTDLTRHYPTAIKAVFDPGAISNSVDLLYYSDELADLGVNTFWVIGEYRMKNYHAYQFSPAFSQLAINFNHSGSYLCYNLSMSSLRCGIYSMQSHL